jgi:8-oxo-dGTP diphosphatase
MIIRKDPPFKGELALPGGFIEEGEKPEEAVIREAKEETNLDIQIIQKVGIYDKPERDPRGRVISHAFLCKCISNPSELRGKDDAIDARWFSCEQLSTLDLAFDHADILADALKCIGK